LKNTLLIVVNLLNYIFWSNQSRPCGYGTCYQCLMHLNTLSSSHTLMFLYHIIFYWYKSFWWGKRCNLPFDEFSMKWLAQKGFWRISITLVMIGLTSRKFGQDLFSLINDQNDFISIIFRFESVLFFHVEESTRNMLSTSTHFMDGKQGEPSSLITGLGPRGIKRVKPMTNNKHENSPMGLYQLS